eukprot:m.129173 g.129173  ORF g.129173 m.129173 type:complete len:82 (-) comp11252_c1_seq2:83-328(-)
MLTAAGKALSDLMSDKDIADGLLYPPLSQLRRATLHVAIAVAREAGACGVGKVFDDDAALETEVRQSMWSPHYPTVVPATY